MGDFHHWDRDGEIAQKAAEKEMRKTILALFGQPPKKKFARWLGHILSDIEHKEGMGLEKRYLDFIRRREIECLEVSDNRDDVMWAAYCARRYGFKKKANELYKKVVKSFLCELKEKKSFGTGESLHIINVLYAASYADYSQKYINGLSHLILRTIKKDSGEEAYDCIGEREFAKAFDLAVKNKILEKEILKKELCFQSNSSFKRFVKKSIKE